MKALIEEFSYKESKISLYTQLDDTYHQVEAYPFFFELIHADERYTDSFANYVTLEKARDQALRLADQLQPATIRVHCMRADCDATAQAPVQGLYPDLPAVGWGIAEGMYHVCPAHRQETATQSE